jgi:hypothetical protein
LYDENATGIPVRNRGFSDGEKMFPLVVRPIDDRIVYVFE